MFPDPPATLPTMFIAFKRVGEYLITLKISHMSGSDQRLLTRSAGFRQPRSKCRKL